MRPAQERLDGDTAVIGQADPGLIDESQLIRGDQRCLEVVEQGGAASQAGIDQGSYPSQRCSLRRAASVMLAIRRRLSSEASTSTPSSRDTDRHVRKHRHVATVKRPAQRPDDFIELARQGSRLARLDQGQEAQGTDPIQP